MFDKVKALRKQGKTPVIKLSPGLQVRKQKLSRGRPRKYPVDDPRAARYVGRRGKNRPYCQARGCVRYLRVHQPIACSEACESRIINDAIMRLKECRISKAQLLELYGDE